MSGTLDGLKGGNERRAVIWLVDRGQFCGVAENDGAEPERRMMPEKDAPSKAGF
jgi:hypothetical protein